MEGRPFCESCLGSRPVAATKSVSLADAGATAIPGSVLEVQGLGFRFAQEGPWILKGLSFSLRQNETVLLMGRSGCGKSTLALLLAGLYPEYAGFSEGSVSCPEGEVKGLSPEKRAKAVSLVFQNPDDQFALDTVEGEVNFSLENVSYAGDYGQRVASLLEMVGLAGFERRKVLGLSGGEKQKLSLATALATEPRLLILDEPLANLDWESSLEIAGVLERLAREGMSLLAIDHRPEPWLGWLSRILFLGPDGRAAPSDITPEEARANPGAFEKLGVFGPSKGPRPVLSKTRPEWAQSAVANGDLAIMAENLSLRRGRELIWEGVSFSAQRGTITAIMGPSGSGKSCLLLALAGLLKAKGRLEINGRVGLVFQNPGFQFLTQKTQNEIVLSLSPKGKGEGNTETIEEAKALAAWFGLGDCLWRSPWQLSQGEQRRLAVLTMLAAKAEILFLDEPTYAQDPWATDRVMGLLRAEVAKGLTAVLVTHDLGLALAEADRVLILKGKSLSEYQGR